MPQDSKGNFHLNTQRAMGADRMGGSKPPAMMKPPPKMGAMPEEHSEEGGVPGHLKAMHSEMGGKHMHVHSDGFSHTSHHVGEDGQVQGPHDHPDAESMAEHMKQFLSEEGQEGQPSAEHEMATGHQKDVY